MFSGFWGWFLVVVIVAVIFGAGRLPELKEQAQDKLKLLAQAAEKGKKELEAKIEEAKKKNASSEEKKDDDSASE